MSENKSVVYQSNGQMEYAMSVESVMAQVGAIQELMKRAMIKDEHYGVIPGCVKPSLLKPGAEKLGMMFRLAPSYDITERELQNNHREYSVNCTLKHIVTGQVWGQGVGSCSTMETKFRYRKAEQTCPKCGKPTIIKGKKEYGGGWLCYPKKGGCGAKFQDGDKEIENQNMGRVEHDNPADYHNTCLKMAKKRAQVDSILTATAASDIFTQDVEELVENGVIEVRENPKSNVTPPPRSPAKTYQAEVVVEREEERAPDPEPPSYDSHPVMDGETEPPDSGDNRPNFADDIFGRLDGAVWDYCGGDKKKMYEVYKTITGFEGSDGKLRYCSDIEQVRKWKNPEKVAGSAKRVFEQRLLMKTKFKFEAGE
jgi:hypothetical protein